MLILASMNMYQYVWVIRTNTGSRKKCLTVHPLFVFYCLTILTLVSSLVYTIFNVELYNIYDKYDNKYMLIFLNFPVCFKSMLGLEQIWFMTKLIIRIN